MRGMPAIELIAYFVAMFRDDIELWSESERR